MTTPAVSGAVTDIAVLTGFGTGGEDSLVLLDNGLKLASWSSGSFSLTTLIGGAWASCTMLHVSETATNWLICGLKADGKTVISRMYSAGSWSEGPTYSAADDVVAIEGNYDFDGDMLRDMVLTTEDTGSATWALEVFSFLGVPKTGHSGTGTVLGSAGISTGTTQEFAVVWDEAPGLKLGVIDSGGVESAALTLPVGAGGASIEPNVLGLATADLDGNGYEDVLVAQDDAKASALIYNLGLVNGSADLDIANAKVIPMVASPYTTLPISGTPGFADFVSDTYADVLTVEDDGTVYLQFGLDLHGEDSGTGLTAGDFLNEASDFQADANGGKLHLVMNLIQEYLELGWVEIILWEQQDESQKIESNAVLRVYYELEPSELHQFVTVDDDDLLPTGIEWGQKHYYVMFRFVELTNDVVTDTSPTFTAGWAMSSNELRWDYIRDLSVASTLEEDESGVFEGNGPTTHTGGGIRAFIGIGVALEHLPPTKSHPSAGTPLSTIRFAEDWDPGTYGVSGN